MNTVLGSTRHNNQYCDNTVPKNSYPVELLVLAVRMPAPNSLFNDASYTEIYPIEVVADTSTKQQIQVLGLMTSNSAKDTSGAIETTYIL